MKKAENNIGNLTNSNNNTITQNNIEQQINKIYCFPGTDNRLIEMNMSHELFPHYIVDFKKNRDGKYSLCSKPSTAEAEVLYPINYKSTFSVVDERYKDIKDARLLLDMIQYADTPVEIKINNFKRFLGDVEDPYPDRDDEFLSSKETTKSYIMPEKRELPNVKIKLDIIFKNSNVSIKNIDLRCVKQISSKHIVLDNSLQSKSTINFIFDFDYDQDPAKCKMHYSIKNESATNCEVKLKYSKFCLSLLTQEYSIIDKKTKKVLVSGKYIGDDSTQEEVKSLERYISILEKILKIEKYFGIKFDVPDNIKKDEILEINELYQFIVDSGHKGKIPKLSFSLVKKDADKKQIEEFVNLKAVYLLHTYNNIVYKIFNKEINIKEINQRYENTRCRNFEEINRIIENFDELPKDYSINIEMVPAKGKNIYVITDIIL